MVLVGFEVFFSFCLSFKALLVMNQPHCTGAKAGLVWEKRRSRLHSEFGRRKAFQLEGHTQAGNGSLSPCLSRWVRADHEPISDLDSGPQRTAGGAQLPSRHTGTELTPGLQTRIITFLNGMRRGETQPAFRRQPTRICEASPGLTTGSESVKTNTTTGKEGLSVSCFQ